MISVVSTLGLLLGLATVPGEPRFGIATLSATAACLASPGSPLAEGTAVTLVTPEKPQRIYRVRVQRRVSACATLAGAGVGGPYYQVAGAPAGGDRLVAVAILGTVQAAVANDVAEVTFGAAGERLTVRSCSSHEGIHLTAWRGKPLEGRRLWHAYWYLGYDVEPSCTEEEVAQ